MGSIKECHISCVGTSCHFFVCMRSIKNDVILTLRPRALDIRGGNSSSASHYCSWNINGLSTVNMDSSILAKIGSKYNVSFGFIFKYSNILITSFKSPWRGKYW